MKSVKYYIKEDFKLKKKGNIVSKIVEYTCVPTSYSELRKIVKKRVEEDQDADLNDIDVSGVTDMHGKNEDGSVGLFFKLDPHNIDISQWDMSKVTDISNMFDECKNFNCDLSQWDVSNVEYMDYTFYKCHNFNCDLSTWDVSNVKVMKDMFYECWPLLKNNLIPDWFNNMLNKI